MARSVKTWKGRTDDAMPPPSVRQRIFERENGTCYLCTGKIQAGQGFELDHKIALKDGGENTEENLFPVHPKCHRRKTAKEAAERAPIERKKQKHSGARKPKGKWKSSNNLKTGEPKREKLPVPKPRPLYTLR